MDTCSTEIVTLIFEIACHEDFGRTARNLGLVSKYFRAIAEPIELRSIAVSGIDQLHGAVSRLENATSRVNQTELGIHHLFISEIKAEHALAADLQFIRKDSYWETDHGRAAAASYQDHQHSDDFWRIVTSLVRCSSPNLRTLYLLAFDNWISWRGLLLGHTVTFSKVLGALSGVTFPNLASLMVNHQAIAKNSHFASSFKTPTTPSLRKLCIISSIDFSLRIRVSNNHTARMLIPFLNWSILR